MNPHLRTYQQGDTTYCPVCGKSWDTNEDEIPPCRVRSDAEIRKDMQAERRQREMARSCGRAPLQKLQAFLVGTNADSPPSLVYADTILHAMEMISTVTGRPNTELSAQRAAAADILCHVRNPSPEFNPESLQHAGVLCREILDVYYPGSGGVVVTPFKLKAKK